MHTTVFLKEAVDALNIVPDGIYIDATYGEGGHAREIISRGGKVIGIEADPVQASKEKEIHVLNGSFADIKELVQAQNIDAVDGVLFDFGLSMVQMRTGGKGLSYRQDDEVLDMRLSGRGMSAEEYLNSAPDEQLVEDLLKYSEDLKSEKIAHMIVRYRKETGLRTVNDLKGIIDKALGHTGGTDTYARIFQAIRIIVNDEIETIKKGLAGAFEIVKPGGYIVVISFHSLEDRVVKAFVRSLGNKVEHTRLSVRKSRPLRSFERSATLRQIKKI